MNKMNERKKGSQWYKLRSGGPGGEPIATKKAEVFTEGWGGMMGNVK